MGVIRHHSKLRSVESGNHEQDDFTIVPSSPEIDQVIPRFNAITISHPNHYNAHALPHALLTETLDHELDAIVLSMQRSERKKRAKKILPPRPEPAFRSLGCKGKSHHKYRRFENANLLGKSYPFDLVNDDDICRELDIYDFMPQSVSSLEQLFLDPAKMTIWEEFVSLSESEQDRLLESIEYEELSDQFYSSWHDKNTKQRRNRRKNDTYSKHHRQQRESQQAHKKKTLTGKQCFDRIDSSLRTVIRRNNIALSLLEQIEGDLVQVFQEDPASIYQCCLDSGYDRFLLHACAQYHNLTCHSFQMDGDRWSQVKNKMSGFHKPPVSLSTYLEQLYSNKIHH